MESDDWRICEFCGCKTNAHLRKCCAKGHLKDGGREEHMRIGWLDVLVDNREKKDGTARAGEG